LSRGNRPSKQHQHIRIPAIGSEFMVFLPDYRSERSM
jgi:hypothetical protein